MTQAARSVFLVLVAATFGAFFLAQRLKNADPIVGDTTRGPVVSGNGDGRFDSVTFGFRLKEADTVDVQIVSSDGNVVRGIAEGRRLPATIRTNFRWDGKDDQGRVVPDGSYRPRVVLRDQGRTVTFGRSIRSDVTPTKPKVLSVGPATAPRAEYVPTGVGKPVTIQFAPQGDRPRISIWRTDTPIPQPVATSGRSLGSMSHTWSWNGEVAGKPAPEGVYVAVLESRDGAGNIGSSIPVSGKQRAPVLDFGRRLPGRAGITVRYLGVQPPSAPILAGQAAPVFVDARGADYRWTLRRLGSSRTVSSSGGKVSDSSFQLTAPADTGVYLLKVISGSHVQRVPVVVQRAVPVGRVLVVLPWLSWQGRNRVDDDGDGRANTLPSGVGIRIDRPFAGSGLPAGFSEQEAPLLTYLDRTGRDYDITTDVALLRGQGPKLDEFGGVILPGSETWLPSALGTQLRTLVQAGGTLVSYATGSLRRGVTVQGKRAFDPTTEAPTDLFGARLEQVVGQRERGSLTVRDDRVDLFQGTAGTFPEVGPREETLGVGRDAEVVASAVTEADRAVVVAASFGKGLVIRTGVADLAQKLTAPDRDDSPYAELVDRTWVLAARGRSQR